MRVCGLVFAMIVLAGCTHHRPLRQLDDEAGDTVTVQTTDGATVDAYVARVAGGVQLRTDRGIVPASHVVVVEDVSHLRGAGDGFLLGFFTGAVIGALALGASTGGDNEGIFTSAGDAAVAGGLVLGVLGGGLGLLVGAAIGARFEYRAEHTAIKPVGPPGSATGLTLTF